MVNTRSKADTAAPSASSAPDMVGPLVSSVIPAIEGATHLTGHVPQTFSVMPKYDGQPEGWPRYTDLLHVYIETYHPGSNILHSENLDVQVNLKLYGCLATGLDGHSYNLIEHLKYDGLQALKYLDESIRGDHTTRRNECSVLFGTLCLKQNDDVELYCAKIFRLYKDSIAYKVIPSNAEFLKNWCDSLISVQINKFPPKYKAFADRLTDEARRYGWPTLNTFTQRLIKEAKSLGPKTSMQAPHGSNDNPILAFTSRTDTHTHTRDRRTPPPPPRTAASAPNHQSSGQRVHRQNQRPFNRHNRGSRQSRGRGRGRGSNHSNRHPRGRKYTCLNCLSRDGTHDANTCVSRKWCHKCSNASHNTNDCGFKHQ